ncbi:MAG: glycosyltransferase family 2 protein [Desulfuromonas sp.]|nr:MAG: glycosyltransferase family 2 protein [Desulfuromonas sp.]
MELSCVILCWNSKRHIGACLDSLLAALPAALSPYEIFIVDNGSTDGSQQIVAQYQADHPDIVKPIFLKTNTGTTYSRNLALKQAQGRYVAILDSDIVVAPGTFQPLIELLSSSLETAMVVPRLVYASGNFQKSIDTFPTLCSKAYRYLFLKRLEQKAECEDGRSRPVDYAISAFWLLRRETLERVGLLDENIFYAPEDVDYCLRIWRAGLRIVYAPQVTVIHDAQEISRGFKINRAVLAHVSGLFYFFKKHGYWLKRPRFIDETTR